MSDWPQSGLTINIYSSGTTLISDPDALLSRAQDIRFSTGYPGGLYLTASFYIPLDVTRSTMIRHAQRCVIRNGAAVVWEGFITEITYDIGQSEQGIEVSALGYGSLLAMRYKYDRPIDRRFTAPQVNVWANTCPLTTGSIPNGHVNEQCNFDNNNRLMFLPKFEAWGNGQFAALQYMVNAGSNVKRAQFTYDMQEGAQAWELELRDITNDIDLFSSTSSGSGTQDITLGTSTDRLEFRFYSRAAQTPTSSSIYAKITNLAIMSESSASTVMTTPSKIISAYTVYAAAPFSACTTLIDQTNTYDMIPIGIVTDSLTESILQFITRVSQFSSGNTKWSIGIRESEAIAGGSSPLIYYEPQPLLTDYDYVVSIDEENLIGGFKLVASALPDELVNTAYVRFRNSRGQEDWSYNSYDLPSWLKYLNRVVSIDAGTGVNTIAGGDTFGNTYLTGRSGLQYYVSGPIQIKGYLRHKAGDRVPAAMVRAGKRLKIENFIGDFGDVSGAGFTFLISQTEYNDGDETISITLGRPDSLSVSLAAA